MTLVPPPHVPRGIQGHPYSRVLNLSEKSLLPYEVRCHVHRSQDVFGAIILPALGLWPLNCATLRVWGILLLFQELLFSPLLSWVVCCGGFALAFDHRNFQAGRCLPFRGEFGRDWRVGDALFIRSESHTHKCDSEHSAEVFPGQWHCPSAVQEVPVSVQPPCHLLSPWQG